MTQRSGTVVLHFDDAADDAGDVQDVLRGQLSAVAQVGGDLWLASDESNSVERLSRRGDGHYGAHRPFALGDYLDLPGGDEEIDVEGLDYDGGYLWLVGSHSLKRLKPKDGKRVERNLERLATLRADGNRYLLARIPLAPEPGGGAWSLRAREESGGAVRTAARLMGGDRGNLLMDALRLDPHLAPFLDIPGKDNGLDVEGIAVRGDRVFLGLRGPVLRGWAVVLELRVEDAAPGYLRLAPVTEDGRPYRKHLLELKGLGVRDLRLHKHDILVLAGPTMDLDGPAAVFRWRGALDADGDTLTGVDELAEVMRIPYGTGEHDANDHPEGIALYSADGGKPDRLLVVYDSPDEARLKGDSGVEADLFPLD